MQARKALTLASPNATLTVVHVPQEDQSGYEILGCSNCDCYVCQLIEKYKTFAPVETLVFKHILRDEGGCSEDGDPTGLVVDVGCNIGYFSMYALYLGCNVVSFDPNRYARLLLAASAALHGHDERLHVLPYAIGRNVSQGILEHDDKGWAFQGIHDIHDMGNGTVGKVAGTVLGDDEDEDEFRIIPLDLAIKKDVVLLKIDTEGYELNVLEGSWKVMEQHNVQNMLVEVKNWTTTEKRDLLAKVLEVGKFEHVYNYKEWYSSPLSDVSLDRAFVDVTETVRTKEGDLKYEDFLFRKAPLPKEFVGDT